MKQILQSLKTGEIELAEIPVPQVKGGHILIEARKSLISLGTEKMLLQFGRANLFEKAKQQPDRVRQVLEKIKTDGIIPVINAVQSKLDTPVLLGYSHVGVVREVGRGVEGFKAGDRAISNGSHAEVVCVPVNLCAKIPDGVEDETASFTVLSAIALQGIRLLNPTLGESVAVIGLGILGLLSIQILRANGCRVIGFDFDNKKVEIARSYRAAAYNLNDVQDPVGLAVEFSKGYGVDGVLIAAATKSSDPAHQAPLMCRKRGRVVLMGVVGLNLSRDDFYKKEISFQVSCSYGPGRYEQEYEKKGLDYPIGFVRWTEQRNFEAVLELMAEGKLTVKDLVSERYPIERAVDAYEKVIEGGDTLGIILDYPCQTDLSLKTVLFSPPRENRLPGKVSAGFIGAGSFAQSTLIPAFLSCGVRLKTISSAGGVSSLIAGRKFGFESHTTNFNTILDDGEINTVVISTQHNSHAHFIIEALNAGKHVFVEKPLCINREEVDEINRVYIDAAQKKQVLLMVGFNRRFSPLVEKLKELLRSLSEPKCLVMTVNAGAIPLDHWVQSKEVGGGRIIGEGCHFIDLLRFVTDSPIKEVHSLTMGGTAAPDKTSISLSFVDGSIGIVHYFANGHRSFPKERLEVFCSNKVLLLDNFKSLTGFGWKGFKKQRLASQNKGHKSCVKAFVAAIEQGSHSPIPFEEILEVTEATLKAAGV